jgi:hypothetical protein
MQLQRVAARAPGDRTKTRVKAAMVGAAALLPKPIGMKLLEQVYLPTRFKRLASRVMRAQ